MGTIGRVAYLGRENKRTKQVTLGQGGGLFRLEREGKSVTDGNLLRARSSASSHDKNKKARRFVPQPQHYTNCNVNSYIYTTVNSVTETVIENATIFDSSRYNRVGRKEGRQEGRKEAREWGAP